MMRLPDRNCHELELRLEPLLAGTLPAAEAQACAEHLADCALCRDLVELARLADATVAGDAAPFPDLVPAVLAGLESGSGPCGRARDLLAAAMGDVDEPLPALDRQLLQGHLASCGDCRAMQGVFIDLAADLPRLAEVQPDPDFVAQVLRRTLPFEVQIRRWWDALWPQLWHRPRFASEAAYVGLVVLTLAFATPGSPLAAVPSGALAVAQHPPRPRIELPAVHLAPRLAAAERALRQSPAAEAAARWGSELHARADGAKQFVIELQTQMGTFWEEAASLLETGDAAPTTPETVKETS